LKMQDSQIFQEPELTLKMQDSQIFQEPEFN
jgi:hypothetical protein